jgi:predicted esterase
MLDPALIRKDPDLDSLRTQERFQQCIGKARKNQVAAPYEKGAAIKGLKTEERYPEEGLRYRLRLPPDVTAERPCRLVVWMHPSGGSMNAEVERLAPMLASHRFALMVFTRKQFSQWLPQEIEPMNKSIADAAAIQGLTVERPILMGFSAGGQVALQLWHNDPGVYGGLVLDAAYPIDYPTYYREKRMVLGSLPESPAIAKVPLFVVVGDRDGGSRLWKEADTAWRAAGVPLTLMLVPGQKHAWLIQGKEQEALDHWLRDLAAGRLPGSKPTQPTN